MAYIWVIVMIFLPVTKVFKKHRYRHCCIIFSCYGCASYSFIEGIHKFMRKELTVLTYSTDFRQVTTKSIQAISCLCPWLVLSLGMYVDAIIACIIEIEGQLDTVV